MKPSFKIAIIVFSSILLISLLSTLLIPAVIDLTKYKTAIEGFISEKTHRDVSIRGIKATIIKGIGAELSEIKIGKGHDLIDIEKMRIKVAILPLLSKRIEMTGISLDNIRIPLKHNDGKHKRITISSLRLPLTTYKSGIVDIRGIEAGLYKGVLTGDLRIEKTEREFGYELGYRSEKVEVDPLIRDAIGSKVTIIGQLKLDGNLKGVGNNIEMLEGSGLMKVGKGKIKGFEFGELIGTIGKVTFKRPVSLSDFDSISGHYTIGGGYLRTEDLELVGKDIYLRARGSYGFINSTLDFIIDGKVIDIPIEIKIEGTSSKPNYHIKSPGAEKRVIEEISKKAIGKGKVDIKDVLKGIINKKKH